MKKAFLSLMCGAVLIASPAAAQTASSGYEFQATAQGGSSSTSTTTSKDGKTTTTTTVNTEGQFPRRGRFVDTLTNVQIEVTLSDQSGSQAPEKKTVSMIVASGSWGKVRSAGNVMPIGDMPYMVDLNIDARPFVSVEGPIQLEMTLVYSPVKSQGDPKDPKQRPAGINQSQTVVLTSGKPLIVSQAADPISDRKVVVEVKATVLK